MLDRLPAEYRRAPDPVEGESESEYFARQDRWSRARAAYCHEHGINGLELLRAEHARERRWYEDVDEDGAGG